SAVKIASEDLFGKARAVAATMLQASADDLAYAGGAFTTPAGAAVTLQAVAAHAAAQGTPLSGTGEFAADHMNYPYGIHVARVRVDRETGGVKVERYVVAYDVGRAVNPMLVEGQIVGACAQGIGGALLEEFVYDDYGQPLAASFADYLMPTCHEVPAVVETFVREDAPSPLNPLGVKGAGEGGITAVGAAIASAIDDALGRPGLVTRLPVSPARLHALINGGG
ncbi:MAG: molybdopterin-dependent oxidoreductase, partial [Rhizobiales bacterium]|nr:molybdopterin-dependent oxidoreductase [Hyphomicrobiales bacterium]